MNYEKDLAKYKAEVNKALEWFDFIKVQRVMKILKWTWQGNDHIPSIGQLYQCAEDQLWHAIKSAIKDNTDGSRHYSGCGGFCAQAQIYGGKLYLSIAFEIETGEN